MEGASTGVCKEGSMKEGFYGGKFRTGGGIPFLVNSTRRYCIYGNKSNNSTGLRDP
jgi:hypothetical protein